jgi:hypothetical protein
MKAHVLTGTRADIAERLAKLDGEIREVIVLIEEMQKSPAPAPLPESAEDMFAEMAPYMSDAIDVDYSRAAMYGEPPDDE